MGYIHLAMYQAAFFLNPRFFVSIQGDVSNEISSGVLDYIERLVPDANTQDKIQKELSLYKSSSGDFGRKMTIRAKNTLLPAERWLTYGGACPNSMRLAIDILSQICSLRGSKCVQIPFEQIHYHRMNYLGDQRLSDLFFVHYNLRLQRRQIFRHKPFNPISVDKIDVVGDWVAEKNEMFSADNEPSNWMLLNQPVEAQMQWGNVENEEIEAFLAGITDEDVKLIKADESLLLANCDTDNERKEHDILLIIPEEKLRFLCSVLARGGLSDNAYNLGAEVLKNMVASAPTYCHLFTTELVTSVGNLSIYAI
ncbi:hypothetical protein ZIOFF_039031 [Zingiber officinale]|uniref:Uncharacterized protein n=1 Tax=Zingiber officinale TaxID=94328 RepID=A0A8J5G6M9_ZINOF|nr:hypothetical protein ZIOFF_039031 [Zingiber officinale]